MTTPVPPIAHKVPTQRTRHGDTFSDPYEWMRDKDSPEVLAHLRAENAYTETVSADQQPLRESIFEEIRRRTVETDLSVPARRGSWWYFLRTIEGQQHPVFCRVPADEEASSLSSWTPPEVTPGVSLDGEETYFDTNAEAADHPFYSLGGMAVSEDGMLLAYSEDTSGDEHFTLRLRNLETGESLTEFVEDVHYGVHLSPDGERAYYFTADAAWRPYRLWQHTVGTASEKDRLLLEVEDITQWCGAELTADRRDRKSVV